MDDLLLEAQAIFEALVGQPPARHAALLEQRCGSRLALRSRVERLLRATDDVMGDFLHPAAAAAAPPSRIGRYVIEGQIGEGGMGLVYAARQDRPDRRVALKLLRPGLVSPALLRRFEHEIEALAALQHPHIAHIYEAGTLPLAAGDGRFEQPYFAMELIEGVPLTAYARREQLSVRARLRLFAEVCEAVQHAHQKGILHRDLKPANILVDQAGRPKVLDFGVARITSADLETRTQYTTPGQLIGTLAYMSPEQLEGDSQQVDTRSDVYALGVVAYELLAGRMPFELRGLAVPAAIRLVCEQTPPRLGVVARELRGDLEAIVAKALERAPDRRYASAAEFAADIRRFLRGEPVSARPATMRYRCSTFVRRHRVLVTATAAVFLTLLAASAWSAQAWLQERRARSRTAAINEFMDGILATADPAHGRADVKFADVLRDAADEAAARFAAHPDIEFDVRMLLARAFSNMSLHDEAVLHAARAWELHEGMFGAAHPETLLIAAKCATLLGQAQRYGEARRVAEEVLAGLPAEQLHAEAALRARRIIAYVRGITGEAAAAEQEYRDMLRLARARLGNQHQATLDTMNDFGLFLFARVNRGDSGQPEQDAAEAAELFDGILPEHIERRGESSLATLNVMANLTQTLLLCGRAERAADFAERVLALAPPRFGVDHALCQRARGALLEVRLSQGRYEEAADLAIANIRAAQRQAGGQADVITLVSMSDALHVLDAGNRLAEAEEFARLLHEHFGGAGGHGGDIVLRYQTDVARFVSRQGRLDEADLLFAEILSKVAGAAHAEMLARVDLAYGGHLAARGEFAEAEPRLLAAEQFPWRIAGLQVAARQELVRLYEAWDRPDEAARWRSTFVTGIDR